MSARARVRARWNEWLRRAAASTGRATTRAEVPKMPGFRAILVVSNGASGLYSSLQFPARDRSYHQPSCYGGHVTFQVGDKVIYPNHGLGIVERTEEKTILGTTCGVFHLRIVANDTTVLLPVANSDGVGLRKAISDEEVDRLFTELSDGKIDSHQNWKGRLKDNSDKMRTGSSYDM